MNIHIGLHVGNIEKTVAFYNLFFGQEPTKLKPDYAKYELADSGLVISFDVSPGKVSPQTAHFGFRVETAEELDMHLEKAIASGIVKLKEMGTGCCYARQDKFWVVDPDGYQWEVYRVLEDIPVHHTEENTCCA
jgi:catechol 2,3-dioxygenase-like lactoylglutathione lyase family enzyme